MEEYVVKKRINHPLALGAALLILTWIISAIYWPVWGSLAKMATDAFAGPILSTLDPALVAKYYVATAEATFFWMFIDAWVWLTLIFGLYGKLSKFKTQPAIGIYYLLVTFVVGFVAMVAFISIIGMWWKPFSWGILLTPQTGEELAMAVSGWNAVNFFALAVLVCNIPVAACFHKWPFAGNLKSPWDGFGALMFGTVFALIFWFAMMIPTFTKMQMGGVEILSVPFGSWYKFLAFCQAYLFVMLLGAEGGEAYPMKLFAKKQPYMGIVGVGLGIIGGFTLPAILKPIIAPLQLLGPDGNIDLILSSLILSWVMFLLTWHHLFDDYPFASMVSNTAKRILIRLVIWVVGGTALGIVWIKVYTLLPFAANNLGMGFPTMGIIAGQFAWIMIMLSLNTYFDKWPFVYKIPKSIESGISNTNTISK